MDAYKPNEKNLRERGDYGVRVARPGYDAMTCAQNQLLFNSGWPILQVIKVIDTSKLEVVEIYEYSEYVYSQDAQYNISVLKNTMSEVPEPPAGYTSSNTYNYDVALLDEYRRISVNRKYLRKEMSGTRTRYVYPRTSVVESGKTIFTERSCIKMPILRSRHGSGFVPFFMMSEDISLIKGYCVLFSVDIATDVDYPYTEGALQMLSPTRDYGIKSSSIFGSRVPGLCSNMFSKLVQAVKTEETSVSTNPDKMAVWSPVEKRADATSGMLLPFEFYSFLGNTDDGVGIDGGCYYTRDYPYFVPASTGGNLKDAWEVMATAPQSSITRNNSVVVLRSPMVSPEYEERVV